MKFIVHKGDLPAKIRHHWASVSEWEEIPDLFEIEGIPSVYKHLKVNSEFFKNLKYDVTVSCEPEICSCSVVNPHHECCHSPKHI